MGKVGSERSGAGDMITNIKISMSTCKPMHNLHNSFSLVDPRCCISAVDWRVTASGPHILSKAL